MKWSKQEKDSIADEEIGTAGVSLTVNKYIGKSNEETYFY